MFKKIIQKHWPLIVLLLLTVALRLWRLSDLFYFTYDESVPAFVGRRLYLWQHLPLIGGATPFGFHLGPYFYWFYSLILALGKLNPISWGYASAAISAFTVFLIYIVGKDFFNKKVGTTAAVFWAFSYLVNIYDRHLWALTWGPITCLVVIYSLGKIAKGSKNYIYLLALAIALSIHADPSNLIFAGLALFAHLLFRLPLKRNLLIISFFVLVSLVPLIAFDLRHDFANTRPALTFFQTGRNNPGIQSTKFIANSAIFPKTLTRLVYTFGDNEIAKQYSYCRSYINEKFEAIPKLFTLLSSITILAFIAIVQRSKEKKRILFSITILLYYIGIQLYGTILNGDIFEHYLTGLFPIFLLIAAYFAALLPKKIWIVVLAAFVVLNLYKLSNAQNSHGLRAKRMAIDFTMQKVGDRPFSLDSLSTCWKYSGYRYLFASYGREPVKSYVDPNFAYLYGTTQVAENHPKDVAAFVIHDFHPETDEFYIRYSQLKAHETSSSLFGNIEVVILDNTTGWFDQPQSYKNPYVKGVE